AEMATGDGSTLESCLQLLNSDTAHPDLFLSVQDALATDFKSLTKTLYDLHKAHEPADCKGSPLEQLVIENFDEEQIWQELELQNDALLTHFEETVEQAVTDDTITFFDDDDEEEEEEEEEDGDNGEIANHLEEESADDDDDEEEIKQRLKPSASNEDDDFSGEDSDLDFDVDKFEEKTKQKQSAAKLSKSKSHRTPSEVDDRFFKLSEMEAFLDDMDRREGKESVEDIDYFQNLPSDDDAELSFDKPVALTKQKKVMMAKKIEELENAALSEKPWQLTGEVSAQTRPENSMLEEDVAFDQASRMAPAITEETTLQLEEIIKQRIKDQVWDDVVRKEKPKEEVFEYKKRLTLDHEKSKLSLAEVYEQEYIKQTQEKKEEEENPAHIEIQKLMDTLFLKLDALSNFHFTPKPHIPEVKVVSNLPSITMEEVAPVNASDATLLAPEEIKEKNKAGDVLGDTEKTTTDKKRERRKKKKLKRLKIQEREKRQKVKEAMKGGDKKKSKAEVEQTLKKLTKGGKAKILTNDGMDKALRSSQAFFSQLQDHVKSQIKGSKGQTAKKKKQKEISVNKLKL
uniref:U3 small nucleolar ribonucleoprotein protein MPP10 n=1 Tax=Sinocyclocheilus grahami TaxID=75366 RepID=A0A672Q7P6_SINGR